MKIIKQIVLLASVMALSAPLYAQSSLSAEVSQAYTSFLFTDSDGHQLNKEYLGIFNGAYGFGYRYVTDGGFMVRPVIGMRKAGASLVYDDMNYSWDLQYADLKAGLGYMYRFEKVYPYLVASWYTSYMLRGFQTLNNEDFNITEADLLKRWDYGLVISPGVELKLSDAIAGFAEFNYLRGLQNIETDEGQKASNVAYSLTLGLSFNLSK